jgi:hypothetical protein
MATDPEAPMVYGQPYTAIACSAAPCAHGASLLVPRVREAIRSSPHGVLVTTGCLLGAARCQRGPVDDSGAYLLVQPCGPDRRPRGTVIGIGPVLTRADAAAVAAWLADGRLDAARLHPRLRAPVRLPWPVHPRGPASQDRT